MRRVVVTGMGVVCPLGEDCASFFEALMQGRSGIRRSASRGGISMGTSIAGEVDFDPAAHFPKPKLALLDRFSQFALVAAAQAFSDARLRPGEGSERAGVFMGSGMGGAQTLDNSYEDLHHGKTRLPPYTVLRVMNNAAAAHISLDYGLKGPSLTFSNACASSSIAIGEAFRAIRHGYVDVAVAGGSESLLTPGVTHAWEALRTLATEDPDDPARSCRPFSRDRTGLVLGEGAGVLVLEARDHAERRGAAVHAEMIGYGCVSDASHIVKPSREGQVRAMRSALEEAAIAPEEVDYINAHGTATQAGDVIETQAIREAFGPSASRIPVSSTKSMHGHLMGAAGAVELIASIMAIRRQAIPPTAHLNVPDPECDLDYVPNSGRAGIRVRVAMSNSFAFGGSNAVLIVRSGE